MKMKKVLIQYEDDDGTTYQKILNDENAEKWHKYIIDICQLAEDLEQNPKWHLLEWEKTKISVKKHHKVFDNDSKIRYLKKD